MALLVAVPVIVGSLGRIVVGCTDRPLRRAGDVPARLRGDHRSGAVHRLPRPRLLRAAARRWLLPRHRRHRVRGRGPVRQRLVPAGEAWPRHRHLRCRHGRHGDQRPHHGEALHQRGREGAVPDHRRGPGGLRGRRMAAAPGRAGPRGPDHVDGQPVGRQRQAADHLAGLHPLRRRVRWVRRLLRLPPRLPQDCARAGPGRRGEPDGRLRRRRRAHAARGRLALRQGSARSPSCPPASPWSPSARGLGGHTATRRHRHRRLPRDGRRARCG